MKLPKKIFATAALTLSSFLINPLASYSQKTQQKPSIQKVHQHTKRQKSPQNRILAGPSISVTGRGYTLTEYCHDIRLNPNSVVNIGKLFSLHDVMGGGLSYDVKSGREGVKYELSSVKRRPGERGLRMTPEEKSSVNYLEKLLTEMPESDPYSVNLLRRAIRTRGVIDSEKDSLFVDGVPQVKPGYYSVIVRSPTVGNYEGNSINICLHVTSEAKQELAKPEAKPEVPKPKAEVKPMKEPEAKPPVYSPVHVNVTVTGEKKPEKEEKGEVSKGLSTRLIFDGYGGETGLAGSDFGIGYGPIAVLGSYFQGSNRIVDQKTADLSEGRKGIGRTERRDLKALGVAFEVHPTEYLFGGVGANLWNYTTRVREDIVSTEGNVLETNTLSRSDKLTSIKCYGGLQIPVGGRFKLRVLAGKDNKMGWYGGAGLSIELNRRGNHKKNHRHQKR